MKALKGHKLAKDDLKAVQRIYEHAESDSFELNLYVVGYEDEEEPERSPQP
jgi:hypothetical protein